MKRIVVVGGGISGLAAAWSAWETLGEQGARGDCELVVLEGGDEVGGKAASIARDGYLVESGPTGFLSGEPVLDKLIELSGLDAVPADAAAARRFVYHAGRLREIKASPVGFAKSGILSPFGMGRIALEPLVPKRVSDEDESVWGFARRRLGPQAADRLIAPMALGVFAGDARRLSLASAFPRMAELEAEYRSLFLAMAALKKNKKPSGGPGGPAGTLTSFAGGLQSLPRALAERAPFEVRTRARATALVQGTDEVPWRVCIAGDEEPLPADAVLSAGDLAGAAPLLTGVLPELGTPLAEIGCPGVAVVALGYDAEATKDVPVGFGALIPRGVGYRILGVLLDTHLFAGRSPSGRLLMRAMIGGATDPEASELLEEELAALAHADLARLFGLERAPVFTDVTRWQRAIPQYELGHAGRVQAIEDGLAGLRRRCPGLYATGNYLHGVAFGKAAASAWRAGAQVAEELFGARAPVADS